VAFIEAVVFSAALLTAFAGLTKLLDPEPTRKFIGVLRYAGASAADVRVLGGIELVLGLVAVGVGGRVCGAIIATLYGVFTAATFVALRRGGRPACGCFGAGSARITFLHLGGNAIAFGAGLALAGIGGTSLLRLTASDAVAGVLTSAFVILAAYLWLLIDVRLPSLTLERPANAGVEVS
jgi:hypothetical protein